MAFTLYNWSEVSSSLNEGLVSASIAPGVTPVLQGAMNLFSYYSPDVIADIIAADYFLPVISDLALYDVIMVTGSDASEWLQVSSITQPDNDGLGATVVTASFVGNGNVSYTGSPAVVNDFSVFSDTAGNIKDSGITAASVAALLAGSGSGGGSVRSATVSITGATASTVITDAAVLAASVVIARFVSSANVVTVQTVLPAAGSFTLVTDTAPSTSVVEYISFTPSAALLAAGVVVGKGSYGGGSATFVIDDVNITAGMVVTTNFQSQVTPSKVYTALCGAGTITFVCSANPGVCVIEYAAMLPGDISQLGLHAENYVYAGGFASIVISDASITAASIVTAEFKSQSVVALIQKVTPSAGTLTVLASIDPGPSVVAYIATAAGGGGGGNGVKFSGTASVVDALAVYSDTTGDIKAASEAVTLGQALSITGAFTASGAIASTAGNITSGSSGDAGTLISFPATAANGTLILAAANAGGAFNTTISNAASVGQSQVISIPDVGASTGQFLVKTAAFVTGNIPMASGTAGLMVDSGRPAGGYAQVTMSAAQFNGAYAAPLLLVAAQGANTMIIVDSVQLVMTYGSAAFANGGVVAVQYDSTANGAGVIASSTEAAADFFAVASTVFKLNGGLVLAPFTTCANKGLYLSNITGAFTTGTGSAFIVKVYYHTISTTA